MSPLSATLSVFGSVVAVVAVASIDKGDVATGGEEEEAVTVDATAAGEDGVTPADEAGTVFLAADGEGG